MTNGLWAWVVVVAACALLTLDLTHAQDDGVREPPTIIKPSKEDTLFIQPRNPYTLQCKARGKPTPTYHWRLGDEVINSRDGIIEVSATTGDLKFIAFSEREEGTYMCVATNVFVGIDGVTRRAVAFSPPIIIKERIVGSFTTAIGADPLKMKGMEHTYMKLECRDKGKIQVPNIIFNWYKSESAYQLDLDNGRRFVDTSGNLHITYLKMEDSLNGVVYRCGVSNAVSNIMLGSATTLEVESTNQKTAVAPVFQYSNDGVPATLFTDAILECFFAGYDPASTPRIPTVKWFDDAANEITRTSNPTKYRLSDDKRQLTIVNAQETDAKKYYCQGVNSMGQTPKQAVELKVISAPIFYEVNGAPRDQTKSEQSDAVFYCHAYSLNGMKPPNPPQWYINGVKSGSHIDPNKYKFSEDNTKLTIESLKKMTDIQCVQCEVKNEQGVTWGSACLNVILGITLTNEPMLYQEIKKGDIINLTVTATTDPSETLAYSWKYKNQSYPLKPPHVIYNQDTKQAYINTSLLTSEEYENIGGVYSRILSHVNDVRVVEMEVVLKDGPVVGPVVSKGGIDMWIIGLIIGILFLIIVIVIIIFVVCRKKQEGDYNVDKKETGAGLDPEKELKEKGFDDYSRPTYDDYEYPEKKPRGELEYDDVPIGGDDESLAEYGDEADTHFNEDGSFIGVYQNSRGPKGQARSTESTI